MVDSDKVFAGSIPRLYDTLMVPLIFGAHAVHMAERVAAAAPRAVLETAAGSGVADARAGTGAFAPTPALRLHGWHAAAREIEARGAGLLDTATDRATAAIAERHLRPGGRQDPSAGDRGHGLNRSRQSPRRKP